MMGESHASCIFCTHIFVVSSVSKKMRVFQKDTYYAA